MPDPGRDARRRGGGGAGERGGAGIPLNRTGTPGEIAATIRFLGSDAAGYVTGQVLGADGGKTA